ncbi:MAG: hypothetical protein NC355_09895 [Blautia sp.]|nr:hypothetical protein [Blautia sp.]
MDKDLIKQSEKRLSKQKNTRLWWEIVVLVALVVLAGTMRLLTGPASATTGDNTEVAELTMETYDGVPVAFSQQGEDRSLDEFVTNVTADSYTYNKSNETVSVSDLHLDFRFDDGSMLDTSSLYVFTCPDEVQIPEELLNPESSGRDAYDMAVEGGSLKGHYRLVFDADSREYRILAQFSGTPGEWVEGYVQFDAQFGSRLIAKTEQLSIRFTDLYELIVNPSEIKLPAEDVSLNYDLLVKKSAAEDTVNNRVLYTLKIYSLKGTPDMITVSDVLSDKDQMLDAASFRLESIGRWSGIYNSAVMEDWLDCYDVSQMEELVVSDISVRRDGNGFKLELPGLNEAHSDGNGRMQGEYYEIQYSYAINSWEQGSKTVNNQVTVSGEDVWTGKPVKADCDCSFRISHNQSCTVSKSGRLTDGTAVWSISIHNTGVNLAGYKLTDTMFGQADAKGLKITHSDGTKIVEGEYRINVSDSGKVTSIDFFEVNGKPNLNGYSISYQTSVGQSGTSKIRNTVTLLDAGGGSVATGTASVELYNISKNRNGSYTVVDENTITQAWKTRLSVMGGDIAEGTRIFDYFNGDKGSVQYMSYSQMEELQRALGDGWTLYVSANGGLLKKDYRDPDSTKAGYTVFPAGDENSKYYAFYIEAKRQIARPDSGELVFDYSTFIDVSSAAGFGETQYYINYAYIETPKEVSSGYTFSRGGIIKTDESGGTGASDISNSDGALTWKVKVAPDLDNTYKKLRVTDRLPEGIALTAVFLGTPKGSLSDIMPEEEKVTRTVGSSTLSCTYWVEDGVINVEFDNGDNYFSSEDTFTITYRCVVENLEELEVGETIAFENSATLWEADKEIPSNVQIQNWTKEKEPEPDMRVLSKTGSWDYNKQSVKYSVVINPAARKYSDSGTIELKDELAIGRYVWPNQLAFPLEAKAELNLEKVKLYYAEANEDGEGNISYSKGQELAASQWSYTCEAKEYDGYHSYWDPEAGDVSCNRYTIVAKIPDGTPLILDYEYAISGNFKEWKEYAESITSIPGVSDPPMTFDNRVELVGVQNTQTGEVIREQWKKSGTSGGIKTECTYEIVKVERGNYALQLPGAEFAVYQYAEDGADIQIDSRTTNAEGKIYIKFKTDKGADNSALFKKDTLYYIQETTAPDGYLTEKDPPKYYFYYATADSKFKLPSEKKLDLRSGGEGGGLINEPVNLWSVNKRSIVENTPDVTELTVEKRWQGSNGAPVERNYGTIYVRLYRLGESGEPELVSYQGNDTTTIDYDTQKAWSFTFAHLTKSYWDAAGNEQPYQYYVEEVGVSTQGNTSNSTGHYLVSYSNTEDGESYSAARDVAAAGGTIIITNKENSYVLPATGGMGTKCYTYGGMLLLVLAGVFSIVYRCKKQHKY